MVLPNIMNANLRSINNKVDDLAAVLSHNNVDIACATETWLKEEIPDDVISIQNYTTVQNDCANKTGGGVAFFIRDTIPVKVWTELIDPGFETLWITLRPPKMPRLFSHITIGVMYHPPNANNWAMTKHLTECIDTILQTHPHTGIFLTGDMNSFKDSSIKSSYSLKQIVNSPTRGDRILDKVLTNMTALYSTPLILPQIGKSDHFSVLCRPTPDYQMLKTQSITVTKRVNGKNEKALFASGLMAIQWEPMYRLPSCKEQFEYYAQNITDLLDTFLPLKSVTKCKSDKPWVTDQYRDLIKQRQHALLSGDLVSYRSLRNRVNRLTARLRAGYYHTHVSELSPSSSKNWWSSINNLMGRNQKSAALTNMANELTGGDELALANTINSTFQAVSSGLPKLIPTHQCPPSILPDRYTVKIEDVEKKLMNIQLRKASGPDGIPNWVYRDFAGHLAPPIASIFNASFREGYIPSIWKSADVVPLPKVNPPKRLEKDLRPISLTPVISKTQESFICSWIWDIIMSKIDKGQFGALKGTCATHALITMMHDWLRSTDDSRKKNFVHIVLLDYAKAFDHVDANILLSKLQDLEIPDCLLRWVEAFLMERRQRVKIGNTFSDWLNIWGTVPQGTLLGVMCFLCLINDLSTPSNTIKYVDDTTIYEVSNDPTDKTLQTSIDVALSWSAKTNMKINSSKTKEMLVSFSRSPPDVPGIQINGEEIKRVSECTLLGVVLNDKLNWQDNVDKLFKKASSRMYFISQLKRTRMASSEIVKVYISLVRPVLEYACQVWHGGLTEQQSDLLESIQERALRLAFPSMDYNQALQVANIMTLHQRREELCKRLFDSAQDPSHKLHPLLPEQRVITHNQRHATKFPLPKCYTNRYKDSFIPYSLFNFSS